MRIVLQTIAVACLGLMSACQREKAGVVADITAGGGGPQPVVVLLGGSEGGQWPADHPLVLALQQAGFATSRLGYFGMPGTPRHLQGIALEPIHDHLTALGADPRIDGRCVFLAGVSKGAELALLLASDRPDLGAVLAIVPSHVVFQSARVTPFRRGSWTISGQELSYVPYPVGLTALRGWWQGGEWLALHELALRDAEAVARAAIPIERANGPILLVSAEQDQVWPSVAMSEALEARVDAAVTGPELSHLRVPHDHYVMRSPLFLPAAMPFLVGAAQQRGCLPVPAR